MNENRCAEGLAQSRCSAVLVLHSWDLLCGPNIKYLDIEDLLYPFLYYIFYI